MSVMSPILRLRNVIRAIGASDDQADEFADAMTQYPSQVEFQLQLDKMFAQQFNRLAVLILSALGLFVAIIAVLMVALD